MISVTEARELIRQNCNTEKMETVPLPGSNGCTLAEDVFSIIDTPPFHQSAMDGYAFSFDDWDGRSPLEIFTEIRAGNYSQLRLPPMQAARIFTGAPIPGGADTVVIQEKVRVAGNSMIIEDKQLEKGRNVRLMGSQAKKGEQIMSAGQLVTPAGISFLSGSGINSMKVFAKPRVSVIVTGNELLEPGETYREGKIYESNGACLSAALEQLNIKPVSAERVEDDETLIGKAIRKALHNDIILLTGGVSAGDYDLVAPALEACGVEKVFHRVKQKPGMPFYFGKKEQALIFGLPGNPASVLTCYYEYVAPAIGYFSKREYFTRSMVPLSTDHRKKAGMTHFLKGKMHGGEVRLLGDQESYKMNSFAVADCLVELEEEKELFKKGDPVWVRPIL